MWEVEKNGSKLFIGGTVHMLRAKDLPLPEIYNQVYESSDVLLLEVNHEELTSASTAFKMLSMGMLPKGKTLADELSPEVLTQLKQFCTEHKIPIAPMMSMKPSMVAVTISLSMMQKNGAQLPGIDARFGQRAIADGKPSLGMETIDEQLSAMFKNDISGDDFITYTLKDVNQFQQTLDVMMNALFLGDAEKLEDLILKPFAESSPEFFYSIVTNRNNQWLNKIDELINTPEQELILVGALHLVGEVGVIHQLEKKGYKVTQLGN